MGHEAKIKTQLGSMQIELIGRLEHSIIHLRTCSTRRAYRHTLAKGAKPLKQTDEYVEVYEPVANTNNLSPEDIYTCI